MPQEKDLPADTKVGDMTIGDLAGILLGILRHHDETIKVTGEQLGKLSIDDFQKLLSKFFEGQQYKMAEAETKISERIFKDTKGLAVAGTAFRIDHKADLDRFVASAETFLKANETRQSIVLAMAFLDKESGAYRSPT